MRVGKGVYKSKEPEISIGNNEGSPGIIPYIFLKESQRKILRLNKPPPLFKEEFLKSKGGVIKQYKVENI